MALTPAQTSTIAAELANNPRGYAYGAAGDDAAAAAALNLVRDGTPGTVPANPGAAGGQANGVVAVNRGTVSTQELVEAVVQSEMPANAAQRDWLIMLAASARVRVDAGSAARTGLQAIFGAATATRANLSAASVRNGSRAEELLGIDVTVDALDVAAARGRR